MSSLPLYPLHRGASCKDIHKDSSSTPVDATWISVCISRRIDKYTHLFTNIKNTYAYTGDLPYIYIYLYISYMGLSLHIRFIGADVSRQVRVYMRAYGSVISYGRGPI